MTYLRFVLFLSFVSVPIISFSGQLAKDAALDGGIGDSANGMIGVETGGRKAALLGSATDAAIGSAILTKDFHKQYARHPATPDIYYRTKYKIHKKNKKCPPGLAMQGRC
jgi:hypothetical protein